MTPGSVVLLSANRAQWQTVPRVVGPPFGLLPGEYFFGFYPGRVGGNPLIVPLSIIDDPIVRGFPLNCQAAILRDTGEVFLTNQAVRVIGG